jgi:CRISPR-associated protein Csb2
MARVQHVVGTTTLPAFFSGHERDGSPARSEAAPHLAFVFDPASDRLLVIAPHVLEGRDPTPEEQRNLAVLDDALEGFCQLRCGAAGLLELRGTWIDPETDPLTAPSRIWESATRYVVTRHAKHMDAGKALCVDVRAECRRRGLPEPDVTALECYGTAGVGLAGRAKLLFTVAVSGPLVLGRTRHLGGGLFTGSGGAPA